jgi:hypothetical protein
MPAMKSQTRRARYQRAIDELIKSGSRKEAADRAGVSVGTIDRWHKEREFQIMLAKAQSEATKSITAQVWNALNDATRTLQRNLNCGTPSSEIRAASAMFDIALRLRDALDVNDRLATLEEALSDGDSQ